MTPHVTDQKTETGDSLWQSRGRKPPSATPGSDILPNALSRLFHPTHFPLKCGAIIVSQRNKNAGQGSCAQGLQRSCRHTFLILSATGACAVWRRVCPARKQKAPSPEVRIKAPPALLHFRRAPLQTAGARGPHQGRGSSDLLCEPGATMDPAGQPQLCYIRPLALPHLTTSHCPSCRRWDNHRIPQADSQGTGLPTVIRREPLLTKPLKERISFDPFMGFPDNP